MPLTNRETAVVNYWTLSGANVALTCVRYNASRIKDTAYDLVCRVGTAHSSSDFLVVDVQ